MNVCVCVCIILLMPHVHYSFLLRCSKTTFEVSSAQKRKKESFVNHISKFQCVRSCKHLCMYELKFERNNKNQIFIVICTDIGIDCCTNESECQIASNGRYRLCAYKAVDIFRSNQTAQTESVKSVICLHNSNFNRTFCHLYRSMHIEPNLNCYHD